MGCASSRYMIQWFTIQQCTVHAQLMQTCLLYIEINHDIKEIKILAWYANTWFPEWGKQVSPKKLQLLKTVVFLFKIFWWK